VASSCHVEVGAGRGAGVAAGRVASCEGELPPDAPEELRGDAGGAKPPEVATGARAVTGRAAPLTFAGAGDGERTATGVRSVTARRAEATAEALAYRLRSRREMTPAKLLNGAPGGSPFFEAVLPSMTVFPSTGIPSFWAAFTVATSSCSSRIR
jgi:hypothetical protein